jgi:hypothetical protein
MSSLIGWKEARGMMSHLAESEIVPLIQYFLRETVSFIDYKIILLQSFMINHLTPYYFLAKLI